MKRSIYFAILPVAAAMLLSAACASGTGGNEDTGATGETGQLSDTSMTQRVRPDSVGALGADTTMGAMDSTGAR
jgi:hypothetical protein